MKSRSNVDAPNIMKLINRFNEIGYWIATEILTKSEKVQVKVVRQFIRIGVHCLRLGNYNSLMEIVSGLNSSSISRLKVPDPIYKQ